MKEIDIRDMENILIGQAEDEKGGTGCTVVVCKEGMTAGIDVRGGGPASRESELLQPLASDHKIHAVVLSGGSAFGLDAAGGVMQCLEENDIGYFVGVAKVPLVCQADLFDLNVGDPKARPDKAMGYKAAENALSGGNYRDGNYGAGCGATVGKTRGMAGCMKSGIGSCALRLGDLQVGAIAAVNAFGDIYNWKNLKKAAGLRSEDGKQFSDTMEEMCRSLDYNSKNAFANTTLVIVITNAEFSKSRLCKIAGMAQDGMARAIRPVHTSIDGDSVFAVSVGNVKAGADIVGGLAADAVSEAILRAVKSAKSAYGYIAASDFPPSKEAF